MRKIGRIEVALVMMAGIARGELDRALRRVDSMRCGNDLVSVGDDTSDVALPLCLLPISSLTRSLELC